MLRPRPTRGRNAARRANSTLTRRAQSPSVQGVPNHGTSPAADAGHARAVRGVGGGSPTQREHDRRVAWGKMSGAKVAQAYREATKRG